MAVEVTFELPYTQWDWKVAVYVAMLGIASGAYLSGFVADLLSRQRESSEYGQIAKYGYLTGLVGIAIGPPILLSHLATPLRAMVIPLTMTNFGSWMTLGAYMLGGLALGTLLMFAWTAFGRDRPHAPTAEDLEGGVAADGGSDVASDGGPAEAATGDQTTGGVRSVAARVGLLDRLDALADYTRPSEPVRLAIGALFGLFAAGVLLYSAMAYGSGPTERVPLWDKTFLIPVQIASGLGAGLVVAVGLTAIADRSVGRELQNGALAAGGLLVVALATVLATVFALPGQVPAAEPAVENMVSTYAWLFIGVAVIGGLVVPVVLTIGAAVGQRRGTLSPSAATASYAFAAALVIVGKIALALSYLLAAEFTPLPLPI